MLYCRHTPFANGPEDTPTEILNRIGNSNLDLKSGNWIVVSAEAKVLLLCFVAVLYVLLILITNLCFRIW